MSLYEAAASTFLPTAICIVLHEHGNVPHPALAFIWAFGVLSILGGSKAITLANQPSVDDSINAIFNAYTSTTASAAGLILGLVGGLFAGSYASEHFF
jgi:hypothetical protein